MGPRWSRDGAGKDPGRAHPAVPGFTPPPQALESEWSPRIRAQAPSRVRRPWPRRSRWRKRQSNAPSPGIPGRRQGRMVLGIGASVSRSLPRIMAPPRGADPLRWHTPRLLGPTYGACPVISPPDRLILRQGCHGADRELAPSALPIKSRPGPGRPRYPPKQGWRPRRLMCRSICGQG